MSINIIILFIIAVLSGLVAVINFSRGDIAFALLASISAIVFIIIPITLQRIQKKNKN
ncbi:hypothetical protein ABES25_23680 [Bacillus gobiensis]|uniref:hypothetical protein n=1 Tax=Bacillus gobiensis TaxID=1441095 RepID=UPI003D20A887